MTIQKSKDQKLNSLIKERLTQKHVGKSSSQKSAIDEDPLSFGGTTVTAKTTVDTSSNSDDEYDDLFKDL
jgi:hypothetical protein